MEALLLALVCVAPWLYGAVHPEFEFLLDGGLALLLLLWAGRIVLRRRLTWKKCPVAVCLAGLVLVGLCQTASLSRTLIGRLSPRAAQLYDQLLPPRPEQFPAGEEGVDGTSAGTTLSLYPAATRRETIRLLAVFLLFAAVRNNLASPAALRRLCIAAVLNGSLLSLFALVQFFTSPPHMLYWRYPSQGQVFGPFVNRNHFACYVDLCIGLGVGLLLSRRAGARGARSMPSLLHDPVAPWLCAGLALMAGSVLFSQSRGGMLALAGLVVAGAVLGWRHGRSLRLGAGLLVGALAALLAGWLGFGLLEARLETLWKGEALANRLPVWHRALRMAADFPLCGSGYGTFGRLEPLYRTDAAEAGTSYEHAHSEFLEVLAEGGVAALLLAVLAVGLVYRLGLRALVRHEGRPAAGLALGCLLAFTGLVLHSLGEFGTHVPAITLLATVLCAHLCALGSEPLQPMATGGPPVATTMADKDDYVLRLGGIAPVLGAAVLVALGLLILDAGWRASGADRWKVHAFRAADEGPELRRRSAALDRAVSLTPEDAALQCEFGYARLRLHEQESAWYDRTARPAVIAAVVAFPAAGSPTPAAVPGWLAAGGLLGRERDRLYRPDLAAGLRAYLRARNACPLLGDAHLALAGSALRLRSADGPADYLRRVKLLAPADPETWYRCGLLELDLLAPREALASWRRSLELSDAFLDPIVDRSAPLLEPREMAEDLLPDRADTLVAAAYRLFPKPDAAAGRRPFLDRAGHVLEARGGPLTLPEMHARALVLQSLGRRDEAATAYQALVAREPRQIAWRFEFARLLSDLGRLEESRRQLLDLIEQAPHHSAARELLADVAREMARKK